MVSLAILAALGAITAMGATSVVNGDASAAVEAAKQAAPYGLHVALSHVPSWTHAHEVLSQHLSQYAGSGTAGGAGGSGIGAAMKRAASNAAKKILPIK
jgi:hypothetical protein